MKQPRYIRKVHKDPRIRGYRVEGHNAGEFCNSHGTYTTEELATEASRKVHKLNDHYAYSEIKIVPQYKPNGWGII